MSSLRRTIASLSKNKRLKAIVIENINGKVTVRLGRSKRILRGLSVMGGSVRVGQQVYLDYTSGEPIVQAGSSSNNAASIVGITRIQAVGAASQDSGTGSSDALSLQGNPISDQAPVTRQVLGWNGVEWAPVDSPAGSSFGNIDGGQASSIYGGIIPIDGGIA